MTLPIDPAIYCEARPTDWDAAISDLNDRGWAQLTGWPDLGLLAALYGRALDLEANDATRAARIGRQDQERLKRDIRRSNICWLTPSHPVETALLQTAEETRLRLNQALYLGLFDFEACFVNYPTGGFYRRHRDSLKGARNRLVSMVTYLNSGWNSADGGQLVIYPEGGHPVSIEPERGTTVLMLSEEVEHEVLACHAPRFAIAGWWRVNQPL